MLMDAGVFLLLVLAAVVDEIRACPPLCRCMVVTKNVYCGRKKLPFIPQGIPSDVRDLYLNGNRFDNTELRRSNFSVFTEVRNLYLSDCGIERIRPDTFTDLRRLRRLALTKNRIRIIEDYAFRGLTLDHLFLGYNPGVEISTYAFEGLVANGLHLQGCAIRQLHIDVIKPLNQTLQTLILEENDIDTFSLAWLYTFKRLKHLRIGKNPFHCNCELRWLHDLFIELGDTVFAKSGLPACITPGRLRGKNFIDLHGDDFACDLPTLSNMYVDLGLDSGRLFCQARGNPVPDITWIRPDGRSRLFPASKNETARENQGLLNIRKTPGKTRELYMCLAKNPAGNVTMNLTVTWPPITVVETAPERTTTATVTTVAAVVSSASDIATLHDGTTRATSTNRVTSRKTRKHVAETSTANSLPPSIVIAHQTPDQSPPYGAETARIRDKKTIISVVSAKTPDKHGDFHFTLVQLISSIVGTFILTLLICAVLFHLYYRRQTRLLFGHDQQQQQHREKTPDNVYVTSEMDEQLKMMTNNQHNQMRELVG